ncbi:MAG: Dyp-type peroxidase [Phototrophicaceae bacterium]
MPLFTNEELADIQGLLLSEWAHLRRSRYLFLQFNDRAGASAFVEAVMPYVTSAIQFPERWDDDEDLDAIATLMFTHSGFAKLALPEEAMWSFAREFIYGMVKRSPILGDEGFNEPTNWVVGGPNNPEIHALVTLDAVNDDRMAKLESDVRAVISAATGISIIHEESGFRHATDKEPFGWLDGISQPRIQRMPGYPDNVNNVCATGEFILGYLNESGIYPPSPFIETSNDPKNLLPKNPEGTKELSNKKDFGRNGTYVVYRKLYQDVAMFWNYFNQQAKREDGTIDKERVVFLAAKVVGRWPSGAPFALSPEKDNAAIGQDAEKRDNFLYNDRDKDGYQTPLSSHIRRANPRDARFMEEDKNFALGSSDKHRIIRRTVAYNQNDIFPREDVETFNIPDHVQDDGADRGAQFFALNASIRAQFEFIQIDWINNRHFQGFRNNQDAIGGGNLGDSDFEIPAKPARITLRKVPPFVKVRGGAYFFMPSLSSLRYLAALNA